MYFGDLLRAYEKAAPPPLPSTALPPVGPRNCPSCRSPMSYVAHAQRYWCPRCKKYLDHP
jgi:predicted amidophosphoribosyltransferase